MIRPKSVAAARRTPGSQRQSPSTGGRSHVSACATGIYGAACRHQSCAGAKAGAQQCTSRWGSYRAPWREGAAARPVLQLAPGGIDISANREDRPFRSVLLDQLGIVFRATDCVRQRLLPVRCSAARCIKMMEDHTGADGTGWLVFSTGAPESPFFVVAAGRPSFWTDGHEAARSPAHFAFRAPSRAAVDAFHRAASRRVRRTTAIPA